MILDIYQSWKDIQNFLGKSGKESFRYHVAKCDPRNIQQDVVKKAQNLLSGISLDQAQNLSLLVNLFYRYSMLKHNTN